jgi:hypothetical protein
MNVHRWSSLALLCAGFASVACWAQEPATEKHQEKKPQVVALVRDKLLLPVPGEWRQVEPRNRIIAHEFSAPAADKDLAPGRLTIMSAGGGVEANIARWAEQFKTSDGKPFADDDKKLAEKQIGPLTVQLVDLAGTFQDQPRGPFGPKVERPDYRMLAAIVPTEKDGVWFIKFYGPSQVIEAETDRFAAMIEGLEWRGTVSPLNDHGATERTESERTTEQQ